MSSVYGGKGKEALRRHSRANTGAADAREGGGGRGEGLRPAPTQSRQGETSWRGRLEGVY